MRMVHASATTDVPCLLAILAVAAASAVAAGADDWRLLEIIAAPKPVRTQGDGFFRIATENPRLSGQVHFTEEGGHLSFRLFRNDRLVWERPAPSTAVMIPGDTDIVIMTGKRFGEGRVTDGRNVAEGFIAYDARGKQIARVDETGPVRNAVLFPEGRLLYLTATGIRLLDFMHQGRVVWEVEKEVDSVFVFRNKSYFSTGKWFPAADTYETTLISVDDGKESHSFRAPFQVRPHFFAVSSDGEYAFIRTTRNVKPFVCDVAVYKIGHWGEPALAIEGLLGGPCVGDRNPHDGTVAIGYLPQPPSRHPDDIEPRLTIVDSVGRAVFEYGFGRGPIDLGRSYLQFDASGESAGVLFRSSEYRFTRAIGGEK